MKSIFKMTMLAALPLALLAMPHSLLAQKKKKAKEEKVEKEFRVEEDMHVEGDQGKKMIIITKTGDDKGKTVIEIEDGEVKVNGESMEDGPSKNIDVQIVDMPHVRGMQWNQESPEFPREPMLMDGQNFQFFRNGTPRALLGVVTESAENGVEVKEVKEESAAADAGLEEGDIIQAIDETKIEDPDQLAKTIMEHKPGDKVTVHYLRNGKSESASAELKEFKDRLMITRMDPAFAPMQQGLTSPLRLNRDFRTNFDHNFSQGYAWTEDRPRLGISVQDTEDDNGVKIIEVDEDEAGAKAGLKEGDLLTQINNSKISSADEVAAIVREGMHNNKPMAFEILRDGKKQTITVKIPKKLKTADL